MLLAEDSFGAELRDAAEGLDNEDLVNAAEIVADEAAGICAEDIYYEWGSLFGVEEGVSVSPYELTYLPGPLLTTTRDLADISGFYDAFGLRIAEGENDRQDHIVFQTEFLGDLALREARLKEANDEEGVEVVLNARRSFVEDHLGRWYWRFAEEVNKQDDGFHAALANLLAVLVETEVDRLDVDPDWVPDHPEVIEWTEHIFGDSGRGCGGCGVGDEDASDELNEMMGNAPAGPDEFGPKGGQSESER